MSHTQKSVTEIISGALELFTRGPRGGTLRKARWNNNDLTSTNDDGIKTYCALGALSMAAYGAVAYPNSHDNYSEAADLVASCIPESTKAKQSIQNGGDIPNWNDELSATRGFTSIKRVFCKALKKSMLSQGRKRASKKR